MLNNDFLVTLISVLSFAGLGTLIRTGLSQLIAPFNLFSLVPNLVGSFVLGITKGSSLQNPYIVKGIGTGLCGSITTFSSFNYEFNTLIISNDPNIPLALLFIAVTFLGSALAFYVGESIAKYIAIKITNSKAIPETNSIANHGVRTELETVRINDTNDNQTTPQPPSNEADRDKEEDKMEKDDKDKAMDVMVMDKTDTIGTAQDEDKGGVQFKRIMTWSVVLVTMNAIVIPLCFVIDNKLWLAALLAPFGAGLRWYLGLKLNKNNGFNIPIGTLMANIVGSILLTSVIVAAHEPEDPRKETIWIEAVTKGFCGCLSTVSSFVGELFTLHREEKSKIKSEGNGDGLMTYKQGIEACKVSVVYFFITIIIAQILSAVPNGISVWG